MTLWIKSWILSLWLWNSNGDTLNYPLIKDYAMWNNIKVIIFLTCEHSNWTEHKKTILNFKNDDIWMSLWDMSKERDLSHFDYDTFLLRSGYPFCVIVDCNCVQVPSVLKEISSRKMFHFERYWLMFGWNAKKMYDTLSQQWINVDAEVALVIPIGEKDYEVHEIYNPSCKKSGQFQIEKVGSWNESVGLNYYATKSKYERRHNLTGSTFTAEITIPKLPVNRTFLEYIDSDDLPYMDTKERGNYRVFQILCEMFNFKLKMRRGKIWGALQTNGFWIGVVGSLNRSEIDLSVSSLRWEDDRYGTLDQTTDTFYINNLFIFRHPRNVDSASVFLKPFDQMVWFLLIASLVIFSLILRNLIVLRNKLDVSRKTESTEREWSYSNSYLMALGYLFQQGYVGSILFISARIYILTWLFFSLVIYQYYASYIVGSLLTEPPKTIKTMKQLLHSKLDLAMDELPYIKDIFHYNTEATAVQMYNKIVAQPTPLLPLDKGLALVKRGSLAFNTDGLNAYPILKTLLTDGEICDLQEVKYVGKIPTGPGLPKKSPLRELIKIGIRKLYETGILSHLWSIWIAQLPKCSHSDVDLVPVDLVHFSSALYALCFGMQLSLLLFICELIHGHWARYLIRT